MPRTAIEIAFPHDKAKEDFDKKINILKDRWKTNSNLEFMQKLVEVALNSDEIAELQTDRVLNEIKSSEYNPYHSIGPESADKLELFVTCVPSIMHLVKQVHVIGKEDLQCPKFDTFDRNMHVGIVGFSVGKGGKNYTFKWKSSPYIDTAFVVNCNMSFGLRTSGLLYEQYKKFCAQTSIGIMTNSFLEKESKKPLLRSRVKLLSEQPVSAALQDAEVAARNQEKQGISIDTNASKNVCTEALEISVGGLDRGGHKDTSTLIVLCTMIV